MALPTPSLSPVVRPAAWSGMTVVFAVLALTSGLADEARRDVSADGLPTAADAGLRAQLMKKWDLNSDGRIDDGEAEVARSRMRRERRDLQSRAGNDPLTGRPRGEKEQAAVVAEEASAGGLETGDEPMAEEGVAADADDRPRLPGTASPRLTLPVPNARMPSDLPGPGGVTRDPDEGPPGSARQPATRPQPQSVQPFGREPSQQQPLGSRAGWTGRWTGPLTGGARAGAPAAAAGYGATGPQRDLNAGRLREELPSLRGLTPRADVSGGLLPTVRQPRQPAAPAAPVIRPPRITAEDIGGY